MWRPSVVKDGSHSRAGPLVSLVTCEPSASIRYRSPQELTPSGSWSRLEANTIRRPSADQPPAALIPAASVMRRRPLPSALTTQTSKSPTCEGRTRPRVQLKASRDPSGDHTGYSSMPSWWTRGRGWAPSASISHRSLPVGSARALAKAIRRPSGDQAGE